ncbi:MAG: L-threonylcarbamoyladenylate synthase [Ignisphaera sp.]
MTKVFKIDPLNPDNEVIEYCCKEIKKGAIVVFPTETVYGLGAHVFNVEAIRRVFVAKGRPPDNPLIVHISKEDQIYEVAEAIPETFRKIFEKLWPGPLTVILKKHRKVPSEVSGGLPTVALRMPGHPIALKLIECTGPLAAPSANISGKPSPTESYHIYVDMFGRADIIIDAGSTFFGVESTIIDLTVDPPILLRPGAIPYEKIVDIIGKPIVLSEVAKGISESNIALAPGMKYKHYAPRTPLLIVEADDYHDIVRYAYKVIEIAKDKCRDKKCVLIVSKEMESICNEYGFRTIVIGSRQNIYEIAKNLFTVLRELDRLGVDLGIVEGFQEIGLGLTIMNRLRKASGYNVVKVKFG